jgi:hypothetical protein
MELAQMQSSAQGSAASYDRAIASLDNLYKVEKDANGKVIKETQHPGLSAAVGAGWGMLGIPALSGTDRADFEAQLDTLKAQTFLPMVQSLKGMGALSDAEGKKLTEAIGALSTKQKETTFKNSILEIRKQLEAAKARVPNFGGQQQQPQADPLKIF